jgi:DNA-binding NtrC family response regulator
VTLREVVREAERKAIVEVLRSTPGRGRTGAGRLTAAAKTLGISRKNLWEKMRALQIDKKAEQPQGAFEFSAPKFTIDCDVRDVAA